MEPQSAVKLIGLAGILSMSILSSALVDCAHETISEPAPVTAPAPGPAPSRPRDSQIPTIMFATNNTFQAVLQRNFPSVQV